MDLGPAISNIVAVIALVISVVAMVYSRRATAAAERSAAADEAIHAIEAARNNRERVRWNVTRQNERFVELQNDGREPALDVHVLARLDEPGNDQTLLEFKVGTINPGPTGKRRQRPDEGMIGITNTVIMLTWSLEGNEDRQTATFTI